MSLGTDLPSSLYRAHQVRELDRIAIQDLGIPGGKLMARAGSATFRAVRRRWPEARRLAVVCGVGNNAGDGYVVARHAREADMQVWVAQLGDASRLKGDALDAYRRMQASGVEPQPFSPDMLNDVDVIVDAIFGTGLDREVSGVWAQAICAVNSTGFPVTAVDIPSGLHADSGRVLGAAVRAHLTVTFVGLKRGMYTGQGRDHCGRIVFDDLSVPPEVYARFPADARRMDMGQVHNRFSPRPRSAHKGDFGHVLIIGGDKGFIGAARLAGEAAARVGAGLVTIATREAHASVMATMRPELMGRGVETLEDLESLLDRASVIGIGPGLGQSAWAASMLQAALRTSLPLVIDADALNLIARSGMPKVAKDKARGWVLTPHPGEAARLLGISVGAVQADRFAAVTDLAHRYGGTWVLKGSGSLVQAEGEVVSVAEDGNPGMASGGMGDVLTGVLTGLVAQGMSVGDAARIGVCLHGRAADLAACDGERGLLASDLMPHLRRLVNPVPSP